MLIYTFTFIVFLNNGNHFVVKVRANTRAAAMNEFNHAPKVQDLSMDAIQEIRIFHREN